MGIASALMRPAMAFLFWRAKSTAFILPTPSLTELNLGLTLGPWLKGALG
jgi:hypothetical protein